MHFFEELMAKARTYVTDEPPCLPLAHGHHQGSKTRSRLLGSCKPRNHDLLAFRGLHLQPLICSESRQVLAIGALGHDPFEAAALCLTKEFRAEGAAVLAKRDQFVPRQNSLETLLTLQQ